MKKVFFTLSCLICSSIFSYSLFLINDSPFELNAIIHSASGDFLGQGTLQPGEQKQWSSDIGRTKVREIYNSTGSTTPFTVTWQCSYEGVYSVVQNVSPGQVVKSSQGDGSRSCKKKPKKEDDKCPPCPTCPACPKEQTKEESK